MTPEQVAERRQMDAPLMSTGGGITGNVLGQVAQVAVPVGGGARLLSYAGKASPYIAAAARGGAFAATQPVATGESRGSNAAMGAALGAAGQGAATVAGRLAAKAKAAIGSEVSKSIDAARRMGIPLNVAQTGASNAIKALQAGTKYLPFSGAASSLRRQQEAFNRALSKTFGADAGTLSDDVMREARKKLSAQFDDVYSRNDVQITPAVVRKLASVERAAFSDMEEAKALVVRNQINKILSEAQSGSMTGQKYQSLRTAFQELEKGNPEIARMVKVVRTELDDAAVNSISAADAAILKKVRPQWANLRTTEDALKQVGGAAGNVRPASIWPLIRKGSTQEMRVLGKIGQNVLKDGIGDSGTAPRVMVQQALGGGIGAPIAMATDLTGLAAGGLIAGRVLNSNTASRLLGQGRPSAGLAKIAKTAPRLLPVIPAQAAAMDIGTVSGYDPNDPRYRGN
jgi:hypothetical protein